MAVPRIEPGPGQESVWDYPRPPRVEETNERVRVVFNEVVIAETRRALRVLETSHPPVYYIPPEDVNVKYLREVAHRTWCEWKGYARYYDLEVDGKHAGGAAWYYPNPVPGYEGIKGYVAFYPGKVDACYVGDEEVKAQPGDFYGGWITSKIVGPFKGGPGTVGW